MDDLDPIADLLRLTGPRPAVPADRAARVKDAVRAEWRAAVVGPQRGRVARFRRLAALAAVLLAAVTIPLLRGWRPFPGRAPDIAARVEVGSSSLRRGDAVSSGAVVETVGADRLALRLASGHSVRLDTGSRARIVSPRVIEISGGGIYVDSGGPAGTGGTPATPIDIRTPAGTVHEVGTQFEVRLIDAAVRVRVREGSVSFRRAAGLLDVEAGRELTVGADGNARDLPLADLDAWAWIREVVAMMTIDGRTLGEFLDWYSRERGLTFRFADADLAASAPGIRLSGSIEGMTLDEALASVLSISGLRHRLDGPILTVDRASGAQ